MTQVQYGNRLSKDGVIRLGSTAIIYDESRAKVLLTRRTDNGQWCLPGGATDSGESVAEGCEREVFEETGLGVRVTRLVGVYSDPDQLIIYPDGNKVHVVALSFEAEIVSGELGLSNETTDAGFFTISDMDGMPMLGNHKRRVEDALLQLPAAIIK
jgi:ADP-ribose pyrophosphatase YjhB (NUDIX family)